MKIYRSVGYSALALCALAATASAANVFAAITVTPEPATTGLVGGVVGLIFAAKLFLGRKKK
jgi:hypothetical protein